MFGYIIADREALSPEAQKRYTGCYCGLCRRLKTRHGALSRLTLTYDMTFLTMVLSALYEPEEEEGEAACLVHPIKKREFWQNEFTDYAADMTVFLAYLKCRDDWDDDCDPVALAQSRLLKKAYKRVSGQYPRQSVVIHQKMAELSNLERENISGPDAAARCFGELMGEIFAYRDDRWTPSLRAMGEALGRFIYIMDAVMDLEKDIKKGSYNPLIQYPDRKNDHYRSILTMLIGECVYYFDKLPVVCDGEILKNILCSGVWTAYINKFYPPKKGVAPDDTGSV